MKRRLGQVIQLKKKHFFPTTNYGDFLFCRNWNHEVFENCGNAVKDIDIFFRLWHLDEGKPEYWISRMQKKKLH